MSIDIKTLGGLLRKVGQFSMSSFNDRLLLQKQIYFMQVFGIYLGYRFNFYICGPYSPTLARHGFQLAKTYPNVPDVTFARQIDQNKFDTFLKFLGDKKHKSDWLELLATIHFLRKVYSNETKEKVISRVQEKYYFSDSEKCEEAWKYLESFNLI